MKNLGLVMLGGSLGAAARYGASLAAARWLGARFPWGTFAVNLVGCFLIGFVFGLTDRGTTHASQRLLFVTGFLGALTTFSSFSLETVRVAEDSLALAAVNVLGSNVAALALTCLGIWLGARK